jgi:hypothetical protein
VRIANSTVDLEFERDRRLGFGRRGVFTVERGTPGKEDEKREDDDGSGTTEHGFS